VVFSDNADIVTLLLYAGKDSKEWEPRHPNIMVCYAQPDQTVVVNMERILPDKKVIFRLGIEAAIGMHDNMFESFQTCSREAMLSIYEELLEEVSAVDPDQLESQMIIGISSATDKMRSFIVDTTSMLWIRQFLFGKPFPVMLSPEMMKDVGPYLRKQGIELPIPVRHRYAMQS
jgi:hypothetical protein